MPWTPESAINAEILPCPKIGDAFDVKIEIGSSTLKQKRFTVVWPGFANPDITIDPIVELWRPINERVRLTTDLNLCIFKHGEDQKSEGSVTRTYEVSYGPIRRAHVDIETLYDQVDEIVPIMIDELVTVAAGWASVDNGLAMFLQERNKSSLDKYLIGIGLKKRRKDKAKRREDFIKEHPELARSAEPHEKRPKK